MAGPPSRVRRRSGTEYDSDYQERNSEHGGWPRDTGRYVAARIAGQTMARRGADYTEEVRRLLDAALTVMARNGTRARARVADIVTTAGLSNEAFYRHFKSKDALVGALLDDGAERLRGYLAHQMEKERTAAGQVRRWVHGVLSQADEDSPPPPWPCCGTPRPPTEASPRTALRQRTARHVAPRPLRGSGQQHARARRHPGRPRSARHVVGPPVAGDPARGARGQGHHRLLSRGGQRARLIGIDRRDQRNEIWPVVTAPITPPSTSRSVPVMNDAAGLTRNSTAAAMSSGVPRRSAPDPSTMVCMKEPVGP